MRKSGFTLIELLAVITILALIALISSISVANMLKDTKEELSASQMKAIEKATSAWVADNVIKLPNGDECSFILLKDLKENGLLDTNIIDPKDKEILSNDMNIKIISKTNTKGKSILSYEVNAKNINNCSYIGSNIYVELLKGLTPVIYDGNNWKVPELNEEWYNYDEQMWANAVVLGKGKTKKPGEIVTVEGDNPDALMMLVYIPRYEYKIDGQYGKHPNGTLGTQETPGEIEVKFISKSQTISDDDYIIHPGFEFGDEQLDGIWVGKFELSYKTKTSPDLDCNTTNCESAEGLRILPNVKSLRYNNVSNFWYAIKSIENTSSFGLTNIDTHMIKNSEWGAVAYLSQSKYGKYGNDSYSGVQKEIYENKSSDFITGSSNGTPSQNSVNTQCVYNDTNNNCGIGASTTGNIYGIYDMSGGSNEYVMGVYEDSQGIFSGESTIENSGFNGRLESGETLENGSSLPDLKYYNKYENETNQYTDDGKKSCNNGVCFGHGISETTGWYNDSNNMVYSSRPWVLRGGNNANATEAGIFYIGTGTGVKASYRTTRIVFIEK